MRVVFVDKRGAELPAAGLEGDNLVGLAHKHGVELEGACACSLACSTCHVILAQPQYDALEPPGEEEDDLLDLAFGLTPTCVVVAAAPAALHPLSAHTHFSLLTRTHPASRAFLHAQLAAGLPGAAHHGPGRRARAPARRHAQHVRGRLCAQAALSPGRCTGWGQSRAGGEQSFCNAQRAQRLAEGGTEERRERGESGGGRRRDLGGAPRATRWPAT